jgi:hypothetical protein
MAVGDVAKSVRYASSFFIQFSVILSRLGKGIHIQTGLISPVVADTPPKRELLRRNLKNITIFTNYRIIFEQVADPGGHEV